MTWFLFVFSLYLQKLLWHSFVHSVIRFRADILDPKSANHFEKFLKAEIKREIESNLCDIIILYLKFDIMGVTSQ